MSQLAHDTSVDTSGSTSISAPPSPTPTPARRTDARRGLVAFLAATFAVSGVIQALMIRDGRPIDEQTAHVLMIMWTPGLVSIAVRLVRREGIRDMSLKLGLRTGAWPMLVAWLSPVAVGLLAYGAAWASGLAAFEPPPPNPILPDHASSVVRLFLAIGIHLTLLTVLSAVTALGEEIGWRGYMLTRLVDAGVPHPVLVSGAIWGVWHLPLIFSGQYAAGPNPSLSALLFMGSVIGGGYLAGYVRLASGSLWPAVLFHSAWNAVIQGVFDRFTQGGGAAQTSQIWVGESGVLTVVAMAVGVVLLLRRGTAVRRFPRDDAGERLPFRAF